MRARSEIRNTTSEKRNGRWRASWWRLEQILLVTALSGTVSNLSGQSTNPATAVVLDQKGCEYTPQILAVQTDQKIEIKNSDPVLHNVHDLPTVPGNQEQNMAQMPMAME